MSEIEGNCLKLRAIVLNEGNMLVDLNGADAANENFYSLVELVQAYTIRMLNSVVSSSDLTDLR